MEKYQKLFLNRVSKTINEWIGNEYVKEETIYQFLHTVKGTAASIGLGEISEEAAKSLESLTEDGEGSFAKGEWEPLLNFLIRIQPDEKEAKLETEIIEKVTDNEKLLLVIDDDITMVQYLKDNLEREGYMVLAAVTSEKAMKLFYDHKPDCILLDVHLPDQNGFELLETLLETSRSYFIPIILLSSDNNPETRIKGYEKGAVDFIGKPVSLKELVVRLENRLKYKELVSNAILIDELTGAFNRKFFNIELNRYLFELKRTKDVLSLVVLDLDHFKHVNDTFGHHNGDLVLKGFAQFIMANKRNSDYLIRYGGEEFILLLPHTKQIDGKVFVDRLLKDFFAVLFQTEEGKSFSVTFSAGVVEINNPDVHIEDYVKRADEALYNAKEQGRNQVQIYEETVKRPTVNKTIQIAVIDDDPVVHELVKDRLESLTLGTIAIEVKSFREGEAFFNSNWHKQSELPPVK